MEKMPYQPEMDDAIVTVTRSTVSSDWRNALPVLTGHRVTLRELEVSDAPSLFAMLTPEEVSRFISPPPTTVEGFGKFITWACAERAAGRYACFAVVPHGMNTAIEHARERRITLCGGRKLHDDARRVTGGDGCFHRIIGAAGRRRTNRQYAHRERHGERPPYPADELHANFPRCVTPDVPLLRGSFRERRSSWNSLLQPDDVG